LTADEYLAWWEYYQCAPWDMQQHALHMGIHTSLVDNMNRSSKSKGEPFKPLDFMPSFYSEQYEDTKKPKASQAEIESSQLKAFFMNITTKK
jgi:hypothetical protein